MRTLTPLRLSVLIAVAFVSFAACGVAGAWAYNEYLAYRQMQTLLPQMINVINAHEQVLQKITGAPTIAPSSGGAGAPPAGGAGTGAPPPTK